MGKGRGFVVSDPDPLGGYLVITAAHCLPDLPRCHATSLTEDRTYKALLGPLGRKPRVWAECLFADPVGDIAVLGPPGDQSIGKEGCDAYKALMTASVPLRISDPPENGRAWLLSLDGRWFRCHVRHIGGLLSISKATKGIVGGMSGSPIVADDGSAIGVVCVSGGGVGVVHDPNPRLVYNLPARFWRKQARRK